MLICKSPSPDRGSPAALQQRDTAMAPGPEHLGHSSSGILYLPAPGRAPDLFHDFVHLSVVRSAQWLALGLETSAGVDGESSADFGCTFIDQSASLTLRAKTQFFVILNFGEGIVVLHLSNIEIFGANARVLVSGLRCTCVDTGIAGASRAEAAGVKQREAR